LKQPLRSKLVEVLGVITLLTLFIGYKPIPTGYDVLAEEPSINVTTECVTIPTELPITEPAVTECEEVVYQTVLCWEPVETQTELDIFDISEAPVPLSPGDFTTYEIPDYRHNIPESLLDEDFVWISSDGQIALRYASERSNHRRGRHAIDGVPFYPEHLTIIYDTWVRDCFPDIMSFEMILGLMIKESSGDPQTSVIDINGRRSSGLLQYNNHSNQNGRALVILPKSTTGIRTIHGDEAWNNLDDALWFTDSWDPYCVVSLIERFCVTQQSMMDIGWSQQRGLLSHRLGRYSRNLGNTTTQQREWNIVQNFVDERIEPWRLI
jgi:hypothetical protein